MKKVYTSMYDYSFDYINCKVGDIVYVYKIIILNNTFKIDNNMLGTIIEISQEKEDDWLGMTCLRFKAKIKLPNSKTIRVNDNMLPFISYNFITIKDLNELLKSHKLESVII